MSRRRRPPVRRRPIGRPATAAPARVRLVASAQHGHAVTAEVVERDLPSGHGHHQRQDRATDRQTVAAPAPVVGGRRTAAATYAQRSADRADVSEVLRLT